MSFQMRTSRQEKEEEKRLFSVAFPILLCALLLCLPLPSFAASEPKSLGIFGNWQTYEDQQGGQTVCYMATTKRIKPAVEKKPRTPYLMITHRPIEASTDVISYNSGLQLDPKRGVKLTLGAQSFDFFAVSDTAWARDSLADHKAAAALRKTPKADLLAYPTKKGAKPLHDFFDLSGAEAAYRAISKACGLPLAEEKKPVKAKKIQKKSTKGKTAP